MSSRLLVAFGVLFVVVACGDGAVDPQTDNPVPTVLRTISGDDQLQRPGSALAEPLVVVVQDQNGQAMAGATLAWSVSEGSGSLAASNTTDASGSATATWTLGTEEGLQRVTVDASTPMPISFQARSVAGPREIAFTGGDIFMVNSDGSNLVQLTRTQYVDDGAPFWSPDGTKVAFVAVALTYSEIRVIDFDTMTDTQILQNPEVDASDWQSMSWSPNGERLLITHQGRLHTLRVDGSDLLDLGINGSDGDFSPDGSEIAFVRDGQVYVVNSDGTGERQLTTSASYWSWFPRWSPDGNKIVFGRKNPPEGGCGLFQLWIMNSDGSEVAPVPETAEEGGDCGGGLEGDWSPDGSKLVYSYSTSASNGGRCGPSQTTDIFVLDLNTRTNSLVSDHTCINWFPAWRPTTN